MFLFDSKIAAVRPYLLLGCAQHEHDYALLREAGVSHILQVGSELRPSFPGKFKYLKIAIDDGEQEDIIRQLRRCFNFIRNSQIPDGLHHPIRGNSGDCTSGDYDPCQNAEAAVLKTSEGAVLTPLGAETPLRPPVVLVHCMAGVSRSATVVVAYLMFNEHLPYTEAFKLVKAVRPCIYPNLGFLLQLWEWEAAGCDLDVWPGWSKRRYTERLAEYRLAQDAAGFHRSVRVQLPKYAAAPSGQVNDVADANASIGNDGDFHNTSDIGEQHQDDRTGASVDCNLEKDRKSPLSPPAAEMAIAASMTQASTAAAVPSSAAISAAVHPTVTSVTSLAQ